MITKIILFLLIIILILISCFIVVQICGLAKNSTKKHIHKKNKHNRQNKHRHNKYGGNIIINNNDLGLPSNTVLDDFSTWYTSSHDYDKNLNIFYNNSSPIDINRIYFNHLKNIIIDSKYYYENRFISNYGTYVQYMPPIPIDAKTTATEDFHQNILNLPMSGYTNYSFFMYCTLDELMNSLIYTDNMSAHINDSKTSKDINGLVTNLLNTYNLSVINTDTNQIIIYIKNIAQNVPRSSALYTYTYNHFNNYYFQNLDKLYNKSNIDKPLINNILKNIIIQLYAYYNTTNNIIYNNYLDSNSPYFIYMYIIYNNIYKYKQIINNIEKNILSLVYSSPNIFLTWIINNISKYISDIKSYEDTLINCIKTIKNYKQAYNISVETDGILQQGVELIISELCNDANNILLQNNIIPNNYYDITKINKFNDLFKNNYIKLKKEKAIKTVIYKTIYKNVFSDDSKLEIITNLHEIIKKTKAFYDKKYKLMNNNLLILKIYDEMYTFGFLFKTMILDINFIENKQLKDIFINNNYIDTINSLLKNTTNDDGTSMNSFDAYNKFENSNVLKKNLIHLLNKMINKNYNENDYVINKIPSNSRATIDSSDRGVSRDSGIGDSFSSHRESIEYRLIDYKLKVKSALDSHSITYDEFEEIISKKDASGSYIINPFNAITLINHIPKFNPVINDTDLASDNTTRSYKYKDILINRREYIYMVFDETETEKANLKLELLNNSESIDSSNPLTEEEINYFIDKELLNKNNIYKPINQLIINNSRDRTAICAIITNMSVAGGSNIIYGGNKSKENAALLNECVGLINDSNYDPDDLSEIIDKLKNTFTRDEIDYFIDDQNEIKNKLKFIKTAPHTMNTIQYITKLEAAGKGILDFFIQYKIDYDDIKSQINEIYANDNDNPCIGQKIFAYIKNKYAENLAPVVQKSDRELRKNISKENAELLNDCMDIINNIDYDSEDPAHVDQIRNELNSKFSAEQIAYFIDNQTEIKRVLNAVKRFPQGINQIAIIHKLDTPSTTLNFPEFFTKYKIDYNDIKSKIHGFSVPNMGLQLLNCIKTVYAKNLAPVVQESDLELGENTSDDNSLLLKECVEMINKDDYDPTKVDDVIVKLKTKFTDIQIEYFIKNQTEIKEILQFIKTSPINNDKDYKLEILNRPKVRNWITKFNIDYNDIENKITEFDPKKNNDGESIGEKLFNYIKKTYKNNLAPLVEDPPILSNIILANEEGNIRLYRKTIYFSHIENENNIIHTIKDDMIIRKFTQSQIDYFIDRELIIKSANTIVDSSTGIDNISNLLKTTYDRDFFIQLKGIIDTFSNESDKLQFIMDNMINIPIMIDDKFALTTFIFKSINTSTKKIKTKILQNDLKITPNIELSRFEPDINLDIDDYYTPVLGDDYDYKDLLNDLINTNIIDEYKENHINKIKRIKQIIQNEYRIKKAYSRIKNNRAISFDEYTVQKELINLLSTDIIINNIEYNRIVYNNTVNIVKDEISINHDIYTKIVDNIRNIIEFLKNTIIHLCNTQIQISDFYKKTTIYFINIFQQIQLLSATLSIDSIYTHVDKTIYKKFDSYNINCNNYINDVISNDIGHARSYISILDILQNVNNRKLYRANKLNEIGQNCDFYNILKNEFYLGIYLKSIFALNTKIIKMITNISTNRINIADEYKYTLYIKQLMIDAVLILPIKDNIMEEFYLQECDQIYSIIYTTIETKEGECRKLLEDNLFSKEKIDFYIQRKKAIINLLKSINNANDIHNEILKKEIEERAQYYTPAEILFLENNKIQLDLSIIKNNINAYRFEPLTSINPIIITDSAILETKRVEIFIYNLLLKYRNIINKTINKQIAQLYCIYKCKQILKQNSTNISTKIIDKVKEEMKSLFSNNDIDRIFGEINISSEYMAVNTNYNKNRYICSILLDDSSIILLDIDHFAEDIYNIIRIINGRLNMTQIYDLTHIKKFITREYNIAILKIVVASICINYDDGSGALYNSEYNTWINNHLINNFTTNEKDLISEYLKLHAENIEILNKNTIKVINEKTLNKLLETPIGLGLASEEYVAIEENFNNQIKIIETNQNAELKKLINTDLIDNITKNIEYKIIFHLNIIDDIENNEYYNFTNDKKNYIYMREIYIFEILSAIIDISDIISINKEKDNIYKILQNNTNQLTDTEINNIKEYIFNGIESDISVLINSINEYSNDIYIYYNKLLNKNVITYDYNIKMKYYNELLYNIQKNINTYNIDITAKTVTPAYKIMDSSIENKIGVFYDYYLHYNIISNHNNYFCMNYFQYKILHNIEINDYKSLLRSATIPNKYYNILGELLLYIVFNKIDISIYSTAVYNWMLTYFNRTLPISKNMNSDYIIYNSINRMQEVKMQNVSEQIDLGCEVSKAEKDARKKIIENMLNKSKNNQSSNDALLSNDTIIEENTNVEDVDMDENDIDLFKNKSINIVEVIYQDWEKNHRFLIYLYTLDTIYNFKEYLRIYNTINDPKKFSTEYLSKVNFELNNYLNPFKATSDIYKVIIEILPRTDLAANQIKFENVYKQIGDIDLDEWEINSNLNKIYKLATISKFKKIRDDCNLIKLDASISILDKASKYFNILTRESDKLSAEIETIYNKNFNSFIALDAIIQILPRDINNNDRKLIFENSRIEIWEKEYAMLYDIDTEENFIKYQNLYIVTKNLVFVLNSITDILVKDELTKIFSKYNNDEEIIELLFELLPRNLSAENRREICSKINKKNKLTFDTIKQNLNITGVIADANNKLFNMDNLRTNYNPFIQNLISALLNPKNGALKNEEISKKRKLYTTVDEDIELFIILIKNFIIIKINELLIIDNSRYISFNDILKCCLDESILTATILDKLDIDYSILPNNKEQIAILNNIFIQTKKNKSKKEIYYEYLANEFIRQKLNIDYIIFNTEELIGLIHNIIQLFNNNTVSFTIKDIEKDWESINKRRLLPLKDFDTNFSSFISLKDNIIYIKYMVNKYTIHTTLINEQCEYLRYHETYNMIDNDLIRIIYDAFNYNIINKEQIIKNYMDNIKIIINIILTNNDYFAQYVLRKINIPIILDIQKLISDEYNNNFSLSKLKWPTKEEFSQICEEAGNIINSSSIAASATEEEKEKKIKSFELMITKGYSPMVISITMNLNNILKNKRDDFFREKHILEEEDNIIESYNNFFKYILFYYTETFLKLKKNKISDIADIDINDDSTIPNIQYFNSMHTFSINIDFIKKALNNSDNTKILLPMNISTIIDNNTALSDLTAITIEDIKKYKNLYINIAKIMYLYKKAIISSEELLLYHIGISPYHKDASQILSEIKSKHINISNIDSIISGLKQEYSSYINSPPIIFNADMTKYNFVEKYRYIGKINFIKKILQLENGDMNATSADSSSADSSSTDATSSEIESLKDTLNEILAKINDPSFTGDATDLQTELIKISADLQVLLDSKIDSSEKDAEIAEKIKEIEKINRMVQTNKDRYTKKNKKEEKRGHTLLSNIKKLEGSKNKMIQEKDTILKEKDKILEEKDKMLEEKDKIIGSIDSNIQQDIIAPMIIEQSTIITTESNTNYLNKLYFMPIQNKCKLVIRDEINYNNKTITADEKKLLDINSLLFVPANNIRHRYKNIKTDIIDITNMPSGKLFDMNGNEVDLF